MKQENFENLSSWYYGWEKIDTSDFSVLKNYFYNLYSPVGKIEELIKLHVFQNRTIPENDLQRIINNFREVYPINDRKSELKGFYFDDRIGADIELYRKTLNNPLQFEILENEFRIAENEKKYREERINIEDGTTYTRYKDIIKRDENDYFIEFNPNIEAEKRFKDVDALKYFNQELRHFSNNNTKPTLESVSIELDKIHTFIQEANSLDLAKIKRTVFESEVNKMIEYRRLKSGYYLEKKFTEYFNFYEYETKFVYGKFILFKDWLEKVQRNLQTPKLNDRKTLKSAGQKMIEIMDTYDYEQYTQDQLNCLEKWQSRELASLEPLDRYNFDMADYKTNFFGTAHIHEAHFDERNFLKLMIRNLKKAKHPVFVDYRKFLKNKEKELRASNKNKSNSVNNFGLVNKIAKQKPEKYTPKTLEELFENVEDEMFKSCFNVLYEVSPPILNNLNRYNLGSKSKGSITAWIEALKNKGFIKKGLSDSVIATILNSKIKDLDLGKDGRTLRNINTTAYNKYYNTIFNLLPELPLSTKDKNR